MDAFHNTEEVPMLGTEVPKSLGEGSWESSWLAVRPAVCEWEAAAPPGLRSARESLWAQNPVLPLGFVCPWASY